MNAAAHLLFGATLGSCIVIFGVELPRRRRGLGRSELGTRTILLIIAILALTAAFPQGSRFFGDRKLDTGPLLNLFLFHDALNLAGQRFRLGDGLLDPPVTVAALGFGVSLLLLFHLRSGHSPGWGTLWRDVAYISVIVLSLIAVRSVVSGSSHIFLPKTYVQVQGERYFVVRDDVFLTRGYLITGQTVAGRVRDKAVASRNAFVAINSTEWDGIPKGISIFLQDGRAGTIPIPLGYESLEGWLPSLEETAAGYASSEDLARIVAAGSLPETNLPRPVSVAVPLTGLSVCGWLIYPALVPDQ
jgi:hypothetical protein